MTFEIQVGHESESFTGVTYYVLQMSKSFSRKDKPKVKKI